MGTVLVTWELGGGLGHIVRLMPVLRGLRRRGHSVWLASRDLSRVGAALDEIGVDYVQAPLKLPGGTHAIKTLRSFPHILHNAGFGDVRELHTLSRAWRNLYEFVRPDFVLFDHSPVALLAARPYGFGRATIGTGFCCPPDESPCRDLRSWLPNADEQLYRDERRVLDNVNCLLEDWRLAPLDRVTQLVSQVDETFLCTFPELDHYPGRESATYWGVWSDEGGKPPVWPQGDGKQIFAYVRGFPALGDLLRLLAELSHPTLVVSEAVEPGAEQRFASPSLKFERERLDMARAARECDIAILNGGHGATAAILLAGKPVLQIPVQLEQTLGTAAVVRLGAGLAASCRKPESTAKALRALLESDRHAQAARRFAERYADFDPQKQIEKLLDGVEEILAQRSRSRR